MHPFAVAAVLIFVAACAGPPPIGHGRTIALPEGRSLQVTVEGQGPDTFLVVGAVPLPPAYLDGLVRDLTRHAVVVSWVPDGDSMSGDAGDLLAIADSLRLGRPILVGHQSGALLALRYASRHPARARALVAISPLYIVAGWNYTATFLPYDTARRGDYRDAYRAGRDTLEPGPFCRHWWGFLFSPREVGEPVQGALAPAICAEPVAQRRLLERRHQLFRDLENWDDRPLLDSLLAPLLVLEGNTDAFADSAAADWTRRGRGVLRVVPGPAFAPWLESRVTDSIHAFVARVASAPHAEPPATDQ